MSPKRSKRRSSKRKQRKKKSSTRWRRRFLGLLLLLAVAGTAWLVWPFWQLSGQFENRAVKQPSRLYARSHRLAVGRSEDPAKLIGELEDLGYRRRKSGELAKGEFAWDGKHLKVHLRSLPTPYGWNNGGGLEARFSGRHLESLVWRGNAVQEADLEPPLLFSFYGPDRQERRPAALEDLPDHLVLAVLAAEDARFYEHPGLSLTGIVRAALANLREGGIRQGGSTLTQQLVKNLFLTQERTLARKLREAALALMIDWRFEKREILDAYLNEIYWGSSGGINLMGVGSAAWAYFGKEADQLDLCESAVLAGMISSPGGYSPVARPEKSLARRNWVLGRMGELEWLPADRMARAVEEPLCLAPQPVGTRHAAYFRDRAAAEAKRRFGIDELADRGYRLLSTLDRWDQEAAEAMVDWGLQSLEEGWEKDSKASGDLQAALVSLDPRTGAILAYVGGRDYGASQFDRAGSAERQAGSAFKPVVYATAFEDRVAAPSTMLEDAPLRVALAGSKDWEPQNSNNQYRGWVSTRTALEDSLNVPTARLALQVGLARVVQMAKAMGISTRLQPVPALALGAFEVTPLELASVYSVVAAGGVRREVHGLRGLLDPAGQPVEGRPLDPPQRVISPQATFLLTSVLQGVLDRGTASSVRAQGLEARLAGKTGTTNDRRDSWFGGFSSDRVSLVWVGYDDNSTTRLSGARAALPIWARFTWKVAPTGGYSLFPQPQGITSAVIDPSSGELATDDCPEVLTEVFLSGTTPTEVCSLHGRWQRDPAWQTASEQPTEGKKRWRWLRKVFGKDKSKKTKPD